MHVSREPPEALERIVHNMLQELQMAEQHAECVEKSTYRPVDRWYHLTFCNRHIERAKLLLEDLWQSNGSV